ncbi:hypothetical protein pipiens_007621 [Culex pipiens pipiens]|uniref:Uncharacterized protein n=1 Tax=Culex pipiens pipiens TaxID=38569 RepID=A0ABD1DKY2_CULPP
MPNASAMQDLHLNGSSNGGGAVMSNGNGYQNGVSNGQINGTNGTTAMKAIKCSCSKSSAEASDSNNNKANLK